MPPNNEYMFTLGACRVCVIRSDLRFEVRFFQSPEPRGWRKRPSCYARIQGPQRSGCEMTTFDIYEIPAASFLNMTSLDIEGDDLGAG